MSDQQKGILKKKVFELLMENHKWLDRNWILHEVRKILPHVKQGQVTTILNEGVINGFFNKQYRFDKWKLALWA